ncbi:MAG: VCBS repeat-containing protein [Acidobacteriota bacterium]
MNARRGIFTLVSFLAMLPGVRPVEAAPRLSAAEAMLAAQPVLDDLIREGKSGWTTNTRAVAAYPLHIDGIEGVSYYEVKVRTGEVDAGYVLVTANRADIEIPEVAMQGPTLTERYMKETGRRDLRVYRYDWLRSAARARDGRTGRFELLAAIGFDGTPRVRRLDGVENRENAARIRALTSNFERIVRGKGCLPVYDKQSLDRDYEKQDAWARECVAAGRRPDEARDTTTRHYLSHVIRADGGVPVAGAFGDPMTGYPNDVGVFNPVDGTWDFDWDHDGETDQEAGAWSNKDDIQFAGDFDRDGRPDDLCVLRVSNKKYYFDYNHNATTDTSLSLVGTYDQMRPVAGDFDSDGYMDDIALFSYTSRKWYFDYDHNGVANVVGSAWGSAGDLPIAGDFDRDGFVDDVGVFRPSTRMWYYNYNRDAASDDWSGPWGVEGDKPFAIDADFDRYADDVGVFRSTDGTWYYDVNRLGATDATRTRGPWGPTGVWWRTPSWTQPFDDSDYPVGCGNTAWAMIYAYWQRFKSKTNLFPGLNLSKLSRDRDCYFGGPISDVMWEIGDLCETVYGTHADGDKYGMTYPWKQEHGVEYARDQGYSSASVVRWRGGEYNKWDAIDAEIRADRPVILLVNAEGWGFPNHYPVIEATVYVERRGSDAVGYLANFGWSDTFAPRWFYSRPTWYDPHQSVFDAYFLRF